jgi:hypothetical protein
MLAHSGDMFSKNEFSQGEKLCRIFQAVSRLAGVCYIGSYRIPVHFFFFSLKPTGFIPYVTVVQSAIRLRSRF